MKGRLIKVCSDGYIVKSGDTRYSCRARGKLKTSGQGVFVGDYVEMENGVITKIYPRKNQLIRPRVSNVDAVIIVVAVEPKPDFYLIDKMLINSQVNNLETLIVVNKLDTNTDIMREIEEQYGKHYNVKGISALEGQGIEEIRQFLRGKTVVLAGQSAVGKTSIVNSLFNLDEKVGGLSEKISRGKHTTTYSEIFTDEDVSIIDSPGFAQIEAFVDIKDLPSLYPEYIEHSEMCKFRGCTHTNEPDCQIKKMVEEGKLNRDRYNRYKEIYIKVKNRREDYE